MRSLTTKRALAVLALGCTLAACGDSSPATRDDGGAGDAPASSENGAADSGAADGSGTDIGNAFCSDDKLGSGSTPTPQPSGERSFTTVLEACSLSAREVAVCAGAAHSSSQRIEGQSRIVTSNGIPDHDADLFPNVGNPNRISEQHLSWTVTTSPSRNESPTSVRTIGFALNGIKFEPNTAEVYGDTQWRYEALTFNGRLSGDTNRNFGTSLGFDCNFAHVQPTGEYHYHGVPTSLMPQQKKITLVGWAADGYPILGRYGYSTPGDSQSALVELSGSYRLKSGARAALGSNDTPPPGNYDGTFVQDWEYDASVGHLDEHLDECNGRAESITIEGTTYDYAYYLTYSYPFMPRCVWGTPGAGFAGGPGPGGGPPPP